MLRFATMCLLKFWHRVATRQATGLTYVVVAAAPLLIARLSADARSWSLVENTLFLVAGTLAIGLLVGVLLGLALFRTDLPFRTLVAGLLASLMVMPLYLQAAGWQAGFGMSGWYTLFTAGPYEPGLLEGWAGAIWVHGLAAIPWVAFIVGLVVRFVEPELEEMALLDGSPGQVLWRVTLPHALPATGLAAIWVAIGVATDMTVTDLFQVGATRLRTYAEEVYTQFALLAEPGQTPPPTLIGVALTGCLIACGAWLCSAIASWRPQWTARPPLVYRLGRARWPLGILVVAIGLAVVGVPLLNLICKAGMTVAPSVGGYLRSWSAGRCWEIVAGSALRYHREIGWSLTIATTAGVLVLMIATPLGWLARRSGLMAQAALLVAVAGMAIPGPLVGGWLIELFNDRSLPLLNFLYDRTIAVVAIAQAIRGLPIAILLLWHVFRTVPQDLLDVAALDGASAGRRFFAVVLPMRCQAIAWAWLAAVIIGIGELSATILVVPPGVMTLGVRISQLLHFNIQNELAGLCILLVTGALGLTLAGAAFVSHRRT